MQHATPNMQHPSYIINHVMHDMHTYICIMMQCATYHPSLTSDDSYEHPTSIWIPKRAPWAITTSQPERAATRQ